MKTNWNEYINIENSISSGQVFLWEQDNNSWYGINGNDVLLINKKTKKISTYTGKKYDFFRRKDNMLKIIMEISKDEIVNLAITSYPGLRLLRQDPYQCLMSFIVASNSNIQKIRDTLLRICNKFGEEINFHNKKFKLFPKPDILGSATVKDLVDCGLGYRAKYIKSASKALDGKIDLKNLINKDYFTVRDQLIKIDGIGHKTADCIMLFSLNKLDSFPLDRWMVRCISKNYSKLFKISEKLTAKQYEKMHVDIVGYFGRYAGYAQQFLFKMERDTKSKKWL